MVLLGTAALAACDTSAGGYGTTSPVSTDPSAGRYYVSIGDSYAAGFQSGVPTSNGFPDQVRQRLTASGQDLTLVNFACGGATTVSVLHTDGCTVKRRARHGPPYQTPQAEAAIAFIEQHPAQIGLVTVSLGLNDIYLACIKDKQGADCLLQDLITVRSNLGSILQRIRAAVGPDVPIVGSTYFDTYLTGLLAGTAEMQQAAEQSVPVFQTYLNPALKATYGALGAKFVDVTSASGGYTASPASASKVCGYTYICENGDIHPRTAGYTLIADLIVASLH